MNWYQFYFFLRLYCVPAKCMCNSKSESLKSAQSHIDYVVLHGKKYPYRKKKATEYWNIQKISMYKCIGVPQQKTIH